MTKYSAALFALTSLLAVPLPAQNPVASFDDITFWTGTGTNRAALVLDFDEGDGRRISVAWGYRWDGPAVMQDMLFALAGTITGSSEAPGPGSGSDARLAADVGYFEGYGFFVNSLTFDARGLGGIWPEARLRIQDSYFVDGTYPAVYVRPGNGTWTSQPFAFSTDDGIPTLGLQDGGWFGVVQSKGEETLSFAAPYAAPSNGPAPVPVPVPTLHRGGEGTAVTVMTTAGYYYQLQAKNTLTASEWTSIGATMAGHGQSLALPDPDAALFPHRFYRVVVSR